MNCLIAYMCIMWIIACIIIVKLTYQVPNLWKRVKTYFVGIAKSGFTTNLCNKLISSWEVLIVKFVIPNPFPIYLECMFVNIFYLIANSLLRVKSINRTNVQIW